MADNIEKYNEEPQDPITLDNNEINEHNEEPQQKLENKTENNKKSGEDAVTTTLEIEKRVDLYDADGDGIVDDEMFEGSTHSFAIYFGSKNNISGLIIAYFVFIMQMILYLVCASQVMSDLSGDQFVIPVSVRFGKKCSEPKNLGISLSYHFIHLCNLIIIQYTFLYPLQHAKLSNYLIIKSNVSFVNICSLSTRFTKLRICCFSCNIISIFFNA